MNSPPEELLTVDQVAAMLNINKRQLWKMEKAEVIPAPIRWNKKLIRWKLSDIKAYIASL